MSCDAACEAISSRSRVSNSRSLPIAHTIDVSERGVTSACSRDITAAVRAASSAWRLVAASSAIPLLPPPSRAFEARFASWCSAVAQLTELKWSTLPRIKLERALASPELAAALICLLSCICFGVGFVEVWKR